MVGSLFREEFPILQSKVYLNTCSLGAYSSYADRRVQEFYREWSAIGAPAWYRIWWGRLDEARATFARLIGAQPAEVAVMGSVSSCLNVLASSLDFRSRPRVVTTYLDFPTVPYVFTNRPGVEVRFVGKKDAVNVAPDDYAGAIDGSTACVVTSHVFFATGAIQQVRAVCQKARKAGALSVVDAYHSAGQLPLDVAELGCDVLVTGGLKWLLGGPGCALMYVRKELLKELHPTVTGWFANQLQFEFDPEAFAFRPTASRFELGTPSLPSVFATLGGMELVSKADPPRIRKLQDQLTSDLWDKASDAGFRLHGPSKPSERAGIVMVEVPEAEQVVERLAQSNIVVDHRNGRVRVSPYFYNTPQDNDAFVEALAKVARPPPRLAR